MGIQVDIANNTNEHLVNFFFMAGGPQEFRVAVTTGFALTNTEAEAIHDILKQAIVDRIDSEWLPVVTAYAQRYAPEDILSEVS